MNRIAVIGAGISGAACARELSRCGKTVVVFEKARGAGGRLSVRRLSGDTSLPSGAASLPDSDGPEWRVQLAEWERNGLLMRTGAARMPWTALGGINSLVKGLLEEAGDGLSLRTGVRVVRIEKSDTSVRLWGEKNGALSELGTFAAVILTAPLPQALELLDASGWRAEIPSVLREVRYSRTVVSFQRYSPEMMKSAGAGRRELADGTAVDFSADGSSFAWKSDAAFASRYWDAPDLEARAHATASDSLRRLGLLARDAEPLERSFHRWRYSQVENPISGGFALLSKSPSIVLCGDAFGSGDAAGACLSGLSAARAL